MIRTALCLTFIVNWLITLAVASSTEVVLLTAAGLLDVRTGQIYRARRILINKARIVELGPESIVAAHAPGDAKIIVLSGVTVLPGLVDCHAHVLGNRADLSAVAPTQDAF